MILPKILNHAAVKRWKRTLFVVLNSLYLSIKAPQTDQYAKFYQCMLGHRLKLISIKAHVTPQGHCAEHA